MLGRDDDDARRTARYVDALLAAGSAAKDVAADPLTDPASRRAARRLRSGLVRVHPSFRFEEELAEKLAIAAGRIRDGAAPEREALSGLEVAGALPERSDDGPASAIIRIPVAAPAAVPAAGEPAAADAPTRWAFHASRPLIVGGVAASAALSLGAFVAWRATRPGATLSAASAASALAAVAAQAAGGGKIPVATDPPLHRGRGSAVLHGILGVVS